MAPISADIRTAKDYNLRVSGRVNPLASYWFSGMLAPLFDGVLFQIALIQRQPLAFKDDLKLPV